MRDRVEHLEQLERAISFTLERRCKNRPQRCMSVLRTVLSNARQITLNVSRVVRRFVEWWSEQHDQSRVFAHQIPVERLHRLAGAFWFSSARDDAPALRYRIDLTLV